MVYHGTNKTETIFIGTENDLDDVCCIDLIKVCISRFSIRYNTL